MAALQKMDRQTILNITGIEPPQRPFELDQAFYYPTPEILKYWEGRILPNDSYILASNI
jgi:hypothetical protein